LVFGAAKEVLSELRVNRGLLALKVPRVYKVSRVLRVPRDYKAPPGPGLTGNIDGYVMDYQGMDMLLSGIYNNPLSGVVVKIEGASFSTTTDSNGHYSFSNVPQGTYALTFTKTGYGPARISNVFITGNGTNYVWSPSLGSIPFVPSGISVNNVSPGNVRITGTTSANVYIGVYYSTSSVGPWLCAIGTSNSSGQIIAMISGLTSGQTYYYQLVAFVNRSSWIFDQPQAITNPPDCGNGYVFNRYTAISGRTPVSSFIAP